MIERTRTRPAADAAANRNARRSTAPTTFVLSSRVVEPATLPIGYASSQTRAAQSAIDDIKIYDADNEDRDGVVPHRGQCAHRPNHRLVRR